MDFCAPMLEVAEAKRKARARSAANVEFREGDALAIPSAQCSFDAVTIAFGLRNMADRAACLGEIRRVLRPGGSLFILEFSQPWPCVRPLYSLYLGRLAPLVAGLLTGEPGAYRYLGDTIGAFPGRDGLSAEIVAAGFTRVGATAMTAGIVALHAAAR